MNLDEVRLERQKCLSWKNIAPINSAIEQLESHECSVVFGDIIEIEIEGISKEEKEKIEQTAKMMKPWRKGPFKISDILIDSEWRSDKKYDLLTPYFNLQEKIVGDIGCNNGYYMFRMLAQAPKKVVGFDPSALYYMQFKFLNHYIKSDIVYELLGVEHLELYEHKFDLLFCLGVLYHRSDPITTLKSLYRGLNDDGELFLDTFMIDGDDEVALCPQNTYSKIPNIYFIPTVSTLKNWCFRAGFSEVEVLNIVKTESDEQRKTPWIDTQSLEDFLDPSDASRTLEGYPAPKRVYIKAKKN
ncbi:MAG: tRNA 5-methoxyuridine(34)/uridine 5-oxyacetic acid(34) synthase CmoB [Campylobacterales bacterium]|nr:tRNA 5-methoxyuridine(34)/uridine 5-oxyacetic acid(34) synthase CmoB [Campylobacterales bacterium]